jgi:hypothetical protein
MASKSEREDLGFEFRYMDETPWMHDAESVLRIMNEVRAYIHDDVVYESYCGWLLRQDLGWDEKELRKRFTLSIQGDGRAGFYFEMLINQAVGVKEKEAMLRINVDGGDVQRIPVRVKVAELLGWLKSKGVELE